MNTIRSLSQMKYIALLLLAASLSVGMASAQHDPAVYHGKFTLPIEALWGSTVLPAGDYTFTVQSTTLPSFVTIRQESRGTAASMIMAQGVAQRSSSDQSALIVIRSAGTGVVRSLRLAELGLEFQYATPKGVTLVAQRPELLQQIRVSVAGK
jgi:hypothetical protein